MRQVVFTITIFMFLFNPHLFSQEQEETLKPPQKYGRDKIGGAGGFTPSWLFLNVDPINEVLGKNNAGTLSKGGIPLYGGGGYAYLMFLTNLRIGGMGSGGSMKAKSYQRSTNITRNVELSIGYGGVTIDYVVPILQRLDIAFGILLGGGGMDIKMTWDKGFGVEWDTVWDEFGGNTYGDRQIGYSRTLSGSFYIYQPSISMEYAILRWLGVRVGVGYNGMAGGSWKLDDKFDLLGVPEDIHAKGLMLNAGIFLGMFTY